MGAFERNVGKGACAGMQRGWAVFTMCLGCDAHKSSARALGDRWCTPKGMLAADSVSAKYLHPLPSEGVDAVGLGPAQVQFL